MSVEEIIQEIELFCKKNSIDHRFVGGISFGGFLHAKTTWTIDIKKRVVTLKNHNPLSLIREDNTIRDIDLIVLSQEKKDMLQTYVATLAKQYKQFPSVSIESPIQVHKQQRNVLTQFVSALEIDEKNNIYFSFENIKQKISWKSIEPWTVVLADKTSFTVRNPVGDYLGYLLRTPSGLKPKDKEKIVYVKKLADDVIKQGKKNNIDYLSEEYFGTWQEFIDKISKSNNPSIVIKKNITAIYWQTIGTSCSRIFSSLGNQFTGVRQ